MRIFDHFPQTAVCPICGKNDNAHCVLIGIAGTQEGYTIEAQPFHVHCIELAYLYRDDGSMIAMIFDTKPRRQKNGTRNCREDRKSRETEEKDTAWTGIMDSDDGHTIQSLNQ